MLCVCWLSVYVCAAQGAAWWHVPIALGRWVRVGVRLYIYMLCCVLCVLPHGWCVDSGRVAGVWEPAKLAASRKTAPPGFVCMFVACLCCIVTRCYSKGVVGAWVRHCHTLRPKRDNLSGWVRLWW